jgi:hypothetical protein
MDYKKFNYKKYKDCYFEVGNYLYNSQSMFIQIKNKEYGDLYTATVNMPDYMYLPDTATIKNYSENSGMTKLLQKLGIVEEIYTRKKCNSMASEKETIDYCQINIEKLKEYSKEFNYEWKI